LDLIDTENKLCRG